MSVRSRTAGGPVSFEAMPLAGVVRGVTSAAVLLSAVLHLYLYVADGYDSIDVIGPMFLVNAVAGLVIGILLLIWRSWIPLFLAAGFGAATLGAYILSATIGFFGVQSQVMGVDEWLGVISEAVALIGGLVGLLVERRSRTS
jgi:hypothetical protein